ncbi:MAG: hypothetical protein AB7F43_07730 [Bacteriovoracia bacterium]
MWHKLAFENIRFYICSFLFLFCTVTIAKESIPIEVGLGPSLNRLNFSTNRPYSLGLKISLSAVLDKKYLKEHKDKIPANYEGLVKTTDRVSISHLLVPDTIYIPTSKDLLVFGATWKPMSAGLLLLNGPVQLGVGLGVVLTYLYLKSTQTGVINFLRPGISPQIDLLVPLFLRLALSIGANTQLYIPQRVGNDKIWRVDQGYFLLHYYFDLKR